MVSTYRFPTGVMAEDYFPLLVVLGIGCVFFLMQFAFKIFVCWLLSDALKRLPAEYRKQQPKMVWLLLIPLFDVVWNYFVYPKISESFQAYFAVQNTVPIINPGLLGYQNSLAYRDTGNGLAMAYCICYTLIGFPCLAIFPLLGGCMYFGLGLACFILLIIYLVKLSALKSQIPPVAP